MLDPLANGKSRTLAGLLLAAAIAPFLLALTACLPVPIGDPEKSRIDSALSGVWLYHEHENHSEGLWLMEPYDARTWLVTTLEPKMPQPAKPTDAAPSVATDALTLLEQKSAAVSGLETYKAWLTPIRNVRFLVMEPKIVVNAGGGMTPQVWLTLAVTIKGKDTLELRMINPECGGLKDVQTPAQARAIISRNLGNPELLDDSPVVLTRVPVAQYGRVENVLKKLDVGNH